MANRSAEKIAESADGNIKPKHLTKDSGLMFTYLYDGPLIGYLNDGEQPHYIFKHNSKGYEITNAKGTVTPHHTGSEGKRYLLITDQRILYVAGRRDGDKSMEHTYEEILAFRLHDGNELTILTTDKEQLKFSFVNVGDDVAESAVDYVSEKIENATQEDVSFKTDEIGNSDGNKEYSPNKEKYNDSNEEKPKRDREKPDSEEDMNTKEPGTCLPPDRYRHSLVSDARLAS